MQPLCCLSVVKLRVLSMQLNNHFSLLPNTKKKFPSVRLKVRGGPTGIHIFDRASGTNLLLDEATVPPRLWSRAPRNVSIALTNACDLHCPFCYAPKIPATLDVETLYRWLDELNNHGCLGIGFGGGEPTLSPHLSALCQYVTRSTSMAVSFTTHGHRFDDKLAEELDGSLHFIRVSMDGVGPTYENLRGRSFAALLDRIPTIRSIAPFGINYVVNAQTFPDLDEAVAVAVKLGAVEFLLLPEQPVRGSGGIDSPTTTVLQDWVSSYRGPIRLAVSEAASAGLPVCNPLTKEDGLRSYAHIDASGNLKWSSYEQLGVPIKAAGILEAMQALTTAKGARNEDLEFLRVRTFNEPCNDR